VRWIAYMPLRGGSKSIPGKNIRPLAGRPLFAWSLGAAVDSGCFDELWAGTDADAIGRAVEQQFAGRVQVFRRGAASCTDEASTESALLEFAAAVDFDVLCTIQATSPLTTAADFQAARRRLEEQQADSLLTAARVKRFYWTDEARPLNYDPASRPRRQDFAGSLMENGAFYLTRRAVLEAQRCRLGGRMAIHEMSGESAVEIDEPADWPVVERLLRQRSRASQDSLAGIRALAVDVDGTLTDGGMYYDASGEALKKFNTRDAHGLKLLEQAGLHVAVVTKERSAVVDARMRKLGIRDYLSGQDDKRAALTLLAAQWGCSLAQIAYIGDDLNDLPGLEVAGFACCPADAVEAVRARADYVTTARGGTGAVREVCELLLAARGC
jgi:YrbI family 3-deoxy-D-manno-octulosonate 8-phosphate phosphatase